MGIHGCEEILELAGAGRTACKGDGKKAVEKEGELPQSALFETVYTPGELLAVSFKNGEEVSRRTLRTTGDAAAIRLASEEAGRYIYVQAEIVDRDGLLVPDAQLPMTATVSGAASLAGFGSANPITDENYTSGHFTSYRGRALAVLRTSEEKGQAELTVSAEGLEDVKITI